MKRLKKLLKVLFFVIFGFCLAILLLDKYPSEELQSTCEPKIIEKEVIREKIVEVPVEKIIYRTKKVETIKEVFVEKASSFNVSSQEGPEPTTQINNMIVIKADSGYNGKSRFLMSGPNVYIVPEKDISMGGEWQHRIYDNVWGAVGATLRGNFNLGIGYSFK